MFIESHCNLSLVELVLRKLEMGVKKKMKIKKTFFKLERLRRTFSFIIPIVEYLNLLLKTKIFLLLKGSKVHPPSPPVFLPFFVPVEDLRLTLLGSSSTRRYTAGLKIRSSAWKKWGNQPKPNQIN